MPRPRDDGAADHHAREVAVAQREVAVVDRLQPAVEREAERRLHDLARARDDMKTQVKV